MYSELIKAYDELKDAKLALKSVGVGNCETVSRAIRLLAGQLDTSEKDCVRLRSELQAIQHRLEQATQAIEAKG